MSENNFSFNKTLSKLQVYKKIIRILNAPLWVVLLQLITVGSFLFATYITFRYIHQPLADAHAFRQTQTALTTYWILKEGWILAYQTPVVGFPWSIPFEFPIYQTIVASIVGLFDVDLTATGRFVSYLFLMACAWPAFSLSRRLDLPNTVPWVFCALLWTSPMNVYWGRTFMIETAALFFSLASIPYAVDFIRRSGGWPSIFLFIIFATLGILQKATTTGPLMLFLILATVFVNLRCHEIDIKIVRRVLNNLVIIAIPILIGLLWSHYTDVLKMANPFGQQITSKALNLWNFGTIEQRVDIETWRLVIWQRSFGWNAGGLFGFIILTLPWLFKHQYRRYAWMSLAALILFVLPIVIFINLHVVHEYYQVACIAYLLAALAIVIGGWLPAISEKKILVPVTTFIVILLKGL